MVNKTFYLKMESEAACTSLVDNSSLWHKRMGHVNFHSLLPMRKRNLVENLPYIEENSIICEVCQFGKQNRLPFSYK